jgi:hypothetical protein
MIRAKLMACLPRFDYWWVCFKCWEFEAACKRIPLGILAELTIEPFE